MQKFARRLRQVFVTHRPIRCAKIDRLSEDLFLAPARSNRLVIKSYGWINLRVFIEPLRIDRIGERCACAVNHHLCRGGRTYSDQEHDRQNFAAKSERFHTSQPPAARGEASKFLMLLLCDSHPGTARLACWRKRRAFASFSLCCSNTQVESLRKDRFGVPPKVRAGPALARETRALPGIAPPRHRQDHANRGPFSELALGFYAAAVQLGDMFHNREPETGTTKLAAARFVSTIEALENPWQIVFVDPNPIIGHTEHDLRAVLGRSQTNLPFLTRIFQGVVQQIIENFMQPGFIRADRPRIRRKIDNYFQLLLRQLFFPIANDTLEQFGQLDIAEL